MISKFQGDGLTFKAKFYGTAVVKEARGTVVILEFQNDK